MGSPASVFTARDGPSPATDDEIRNGLPLPETASRRRFVRLSGRLCNAVLSAAAVIIAVPADRLTARKLRGAQGLEERMSLRAVL